MERKEQLKAEARVRQEVYDRVMLVFKHGRQISNPEELTMAIFGHPGVKIVLTEGKEEMV